MSTQQNQPKVVLHNRQNSWFDGTQWIPVENMSAEHLQAAKIFAQRKEKQLWKQSSAFARKVEMLEGEAKRRGLALQDARGEFHSNSRQMKENPKKFLAKNGLDIKPHVGVTA